MGLEDYLTKVKDQSKAAFRGSKKDLSDYLVDHELKDYFLDESITDERRHEMRKDLERKLDSEMEKYKSELGGVLRKAGENSTMAAAVFNDIYGFVSGAPISNITGLGYALFAIKSGIEIPANIRYLKKSHDWYGELKHWALKPLRYLIPVVGPALEAGAFERMVRKGIIKRTKKEFIKDYGDYKNNSEIIKERLSKPLEESLAKAA